MDDPSDQIGDQLRDARERAGLTAADVNFKTRLPISVIAALEAGEFSEFASPTYAKSFLAQYSSFLNVDAKLWLDALEPAEFVTGAMGRPVWEAPKPLRETQVLPRASSSGWASALGVLAVSAGLLYGAMKGYEYLENRFGTEPKAMTETQGDKAGDDPLKHVDRTMSAAVESKGISETPPVESSEPIQRAIIVTLSGRQNLRFNLVRFFTMKRFLTILSGIVAVAGAAHAESGSGWVTYEGGDGPGKGKHVVLLAGDEEYRSEEALPMLAKILAKRHGFTCTVLFSTDPDGTINPNAGNSLGKPEALESADVIITSLRFRKWPDATMGIFEKAVAKGIPIIGMRTSTHMFQLPGTSAFAKYNSFGKNVLGEQWVNHWGKHASEGTRTIPESSAANDPLLRGVGEIFGTTDVYEAYPPADATILLRGQVVNGMTAKDPAAAYQKQRASDKQMQDINTPMMPVAWHREVKTGDKSQRVLCTTMGAATDLTDENLRRLVVNGVFWGLGMEVPAKADVTIAGDYQPSKFGFGGGKKGLKAADFE